MPDFEPEHFGPEPYGRTKVTNELWVDYDIYSQDPIRAAENELAASGAYDYLNQLP